MSPSDAMSAFVMGMLGGVFGSLLVHFITALTDEEDDDA